MLASITPLGERGRASRWWLTVAAHTIGSTVAGGAVGALLGWAGGPLPLGPGARRWLVVAVLLSAAAWEAGGRRPPSPRRQVDESWLGRYRGWVYGAGFGIQLGAGMATIATTAFVHATLAAELLSGSAPAGLIVGASFGTARALPVLATVRVTTPERLFVLHRALRRGAPAASRLTGLAGLALAGLLAMARP